MEKFLVHVDRVEYKRKPKEAITAINNRLADSHFKTLSLPELAKEFESGKSCVLAHFEGKRKSENFHHSRLIGLDGDNGTPLEKVLEGLRGTPYQPAFVYYSFSHTPEKPKYRLVFALTESIRDHKEYTRLVNFLNKEVMKHVEGLQLDEGVKDACRIFYGTCHPVQEINFDNRINTQDLRRYAKREQEQAINFQQAKARKEQAEIKNDSKQYSNKPTVEALKQMAEKIGFVESYNEIDGVTHGWFKLCMAVKTYASDGFITYDEAYEVCEIMSDGSLSNHWNKWNPKAEGVVRVNIGTFIQEAQNNGYRLSYKNFEETQTSIETETLRFDRYLSDHSERIRELLVTNGKFLVEADTGSGKTKTFVDQMKDLTKVVMNEIKRLSPNDTTQENQEKFKRFFNNKTRVDVNEKLELNNMTNDYFIFTCPTRRLAGQVAEGFNLPLIMGDNKNTRSTTEEKENLVYHTMKTALANGQKIFVCTYEMALAVRNLLFSITKKNYLKIRLVVDEVHKFIHERGFRRETIDQLEAIAEDAETVIGLTGTPKDLDYSEFDKMIIFKKKDNQKLFANLVHYQYEQESKDNDANYYLSDICLLLDGKVKTGHKVLLFLNNKDQIQYLQQLLENRKLNVSVFTSDSKDTNDDEYELLEKESRISEETDVILSTKIIAEGVNIINETFEKLGCYNKLCCYVVCNSKTNTFNPSLIKQMSNRWRKRYAEFGIITKQISEKENDKGFNLESIYQYYLKRAEELKDSLINDPDFDVRKFLTDKIEQNNGLVEKDNTLEVDKGYIRYKAVQERDKHLSNHLNQFVDAVASMFPNMTMQTFSTDQHKTLTSYIEDVKAEDKETVKREIDVLEEGTKKRKEWQRQRFQELFTHAIYNQMQEEFKNTEYGKFRRESDDWQVKAAVINSKYLPFAETKRLAENVTRKNEIKAFERELNIICNNILYMSGNVRNATITVLKVIQNEIVGKWFSSEELNEKKKKIRTKFNIPIKDINKGLEHFTKQQKRKQTNEKREYWVMFEGLKKLGSVAQNEKFNVDALKVAEAVKKYAEIHSKKVHQKIIFNVLNELHKQSQQLNFFDRTTETHESTQKQEERLKRLERFTGVKVAI